MSKPRMYGMNSAYIPNSKANMRHRKKVYQLSREKPTTIREDQKEEQRKKKHSGFRLMGN